MTATNFNGVYIVGKRRADAPNTPVANAKRVAEAIRRTAQYRKVGYRTGNPEEVESCAKK